MIKGNRSNFIKKGILSIGLVSIVIATPINSNASSIMKITGLNDSNDSSVSVNRDWYRYRYGWMFGDYINRDIIGPDENMNIDKDQERNIEEIEEEEKEELIPTRLIGKIHITTNDLNMREGPLKSYESMLVIPKGMNVEIIDGRNTWWKIEYDNKEGFVNSNFMESLLPSEYEEMKVVREREKLVDTAMSLVGKVGYFWGGKSEITGWNDNWGKPREVVSDGSSTTGKLIPFGLDCSGFVDWAYRTAGLGDMFSHGGTASQWESSREVEKEELLLGDVAFKQSPKVKGTNHIGIYVGDNEKGEEMFVHCAYGRGVVVTTARDAKLSHYRRANSMF